MARSNKTASDTVQYDDADELPDLEATTVAENGASGGVSDDEFVVNLADVKPLNFDPVPNGDYDVVVVKVVNGRSKSGALKKSVHFEIEQDADGDTEYAGRKIFDDFSFHPKAMWMTANKLEACGIPRDYSGAITNDMLMGARLRVSVSTTTPSGISERTGEPYKARNEITAWKPYGGGGTDVDSILG